MMAREWKSRGRHATGTRGCCDATRLLFVLSSLLAIVLTQP